MDAHLKAAALSYAERGYRVFPCEVGGKKPATAHGCKDATLDAEQIETWWGSAAYNIGIATDGLLVVDIDGKDNQWLSGEADKLRDLMKGPICLTPRGGSHRYFRGGGYRNSAGALAPGIDTRGDGGYVVAPPSVLAGGGGYQWIPGSELECSPQDLPAPPTWLTGQLATRHDQPSARTNNEEPVDPIPSGQRNQALASLAGSMRRVGSNGATIRAALHAANVTRCNPPLPSQEVDSIAASIAKYEPDSFAQALAENLFEQVFGEEPEKIEPFPKALLNPGGLLSAIAEYTLARSYRRQPVLALAGAITLMSVLTGRKIRDQTNARTNIYVLGVAKTGHGKDAARKTNRHLLTMSGAMNMLGSETPASGAGVLNAVVAQPCQLMQWDEVGRVLKSIAAARHAPHLDGILTVLMNLFTSSSSMATSAGYADIERCKSVTNPHLVIYGTTTPDNLYQSLTAESVADGFFGRLLIFEADDEIPPPMSPTLAEDGELIERVKQWVDYSPGGNLTSIHPEPETYEDTPAAAAVWVRAQEYFEDQIRAAEGAGAVWVRAYEKARKLALIHAASAGECEISGEAAQWGFDLASYLTRKLVSVAKLWVGESDHERHCKKVMRMAIAAPDMRVTKTQITRCLKHLKRHDREAVLETLIETGQIVPEIIPGASKPTTAYRVPRRDNSLNSQVPARSVSEFSVVG
jgi:hypothetical protein